jgi:hypothetical protein
MIQHPARAGSRSHADSAQSGAAWLLLPTERDQADSITRGRSMDTLSDSPGVSSLNALFGTSVAGRESGWPGNRHTQIPRSLAVACCAPAIHSTKSHPMAPPDGALSETRVATHLWARSIASPSLANDGSSAKEP